MYAHHMPTLCLWKAEEWIGSPGAEVTGYRQMPTTM